MELKKVDHIGINTLDIERSVQFYEEMFGFKEINRADMGEVTLVYMEAFPGFSLELFDLRGNTEAGERPENLQGLRHFAFYVDDIQAWNKKLKEKKADFVMELTKMDQIKRYGILIKDPDGVIIELTSSY